MKNKKLAREIYEVIKNHKTRKFAKNMWTTELDGIKVSCPFTVFLRNTGIIDANISPIMYYVDSGFGLIEFFNLLTGENFQPVIEKYDGGKNKVISRKYALKRLRNALQI